MAHDLRRIRHFIAALVGRERLLLAARVALYAALLSVAIEVLLVAAAAGRWDRSLAVGGLVLLVGIGAWMAVVVPLARRWGPTGDRLRQARLVEALAPQLRGRLITAVERSEGPQGQESPALLGLVARRAADGVSDLRPHRVHPAGALMRLSAITAFCVLAGLMVLVASPGGPLGTARWWLAGVSTEAAATTASFDPQTEHARVGDLVLEYTFPDYTGLDPVVVNNSTGDAHGPPGTQVRVVARSAEPVEAAALVAYDEPALDAQVDDAGRTLSGTFTIQSEPGTYHLVTYRGGSPLDSRPFAITPEIDLPPDVTIDLEAEVLEIAVDEPIEFPWRARDDYGVSRVVLDVDGHEQGRPILAPRERRAEVSGEVSTRPMSLGLVPGDRVKLRVVAWDNDTWSGSKSGASRAVEIVVLGARGLDMKDAERQEELRDLMLDALADHLEEPGPVAQTEDGIAKWGEVVAKRYEPLEEAVTDYWDGMAANSLDYDVVERVQRTGRELIRYTQVAFTPGSLERPDPDDVKVARDLREKAIVALEDGILALDRMIMARALKFLAQDAQELAQTAENLKEMMEGEPEAEEILSRLDALERQLESLAQSAAQLDEGGLKEFVNQREGELSSLLEEIRQAVAEGRMDDAKELMAQLERQIRQLSEGIQDNLDQMISEGEDQMAQAQELRERLEELEQKQLALQEEVRELRERSDAQSAEQAEELWKEIQERTDRLVERGQDYSEGLEKAGRSFNEQEVARGATEQLEHLSESADARDVNGLRQSLPQANLDWSMVDRRRQQHEDAMGKLDGPGRAETARIQQDLDELEELLDQLEETSRGVSPATREAVRREREQQQQLQQELGEARQQARDIVQNFPVRPENMEQSLRDADQQMGQASSDLERGQPMQAEGAQEMAAQGLRDAQEALERAMEQAAQQQQQLTQPQSGQDQQQSSGTEGESKQPDDRARVELPSPEEFRTPEEYRQALLEGMEGDVPEEYRALKKRYYEELVSQ